MKKALLGLIFTALSLIASDGAALTSKCAACHGAVFEKSALGQSAIVSGQSAMEIYGKLIAYRGGTRNAAGMGALMKGQVASMSDNDLWEVANYITSLSEEASPANDWPFVCDKSDISWVDAGRYFKVSANVTMFPVIGADSKTIQIDRKNKTIKVWSIWLASKQKRQDKIQDMGKFADYKNYGYTKSLDIINYAKMKFKTVSDTQYNCDGSTIDSYRDDKIWNDIVPDSVMENMTQRIMQKYKLK